MVSACCLQESREQGLREPVQKIWVAIAALGMDLGKGKPRLFIVALF